MQPIKTLGFLKQSCQLDGLSVSFIQHPLFLSLMTAISFHVTHDFELTTFFVTYDVALKLASFIFVANIVPLSKIHLQIISLNDKGLCIHHMWPPTCMIYFVLFLIFIFYKAQKIDFLDRLQLVQIFKMNLQ